MLHASTYGFWQIDQRINAKIIIARPALYVLYVAQVYCTVKGATTGIDLLETQCAAALVVRRRIGEAAIRC